MLAHGSGAAVALAARPAPHVTGLVLLSPYGLIRPAVPVRVTAALWRWRIAHTPTAGVRLLARLAGPGFTPPAALVEWLRLVGRHVAMSPVTFLIKPGEGLQATGHGMTCRPCR